MADTDHIAKLSSAQRDQRRRWQRGLITVYLLLWSALAVAPYHRQDWALENILVFAYALVLIFTRKRVPLSPTANTMVFLFLFFHAIGAHYTYSRVPYSQWLLDLFDVDINAVMGWQRNHYDRAIHFMYGLLLVLPVREWCLRISDVRGRLSYVLPTLVLSAGSVFYELLEWFAAMLFGADLGMLYVGAQGDVWDAQQDMVLANLAALLVMMLCYFRDRWRTTK